MQLFKYETLPGVVHAIAPTIVILCLGMPVFGGSTRTWSESEYAEFEKGNIKNLSLRSDGVISLAPRFEELYDSSSAYLWTLARDSKGNLYAGGGPGAKLYRISAKGEKKTLAELDGLEIHAIVVDSKDHVYAATSPDGKIYRVAANGKADVFYNPKQKYIWGMVLDSKGDLFVATGDQGEIHKITPDGKGKVFFKTDELHARSMAIDAHDNLIVGTDPGGLVMRISPAAEGFVLYQMAKKEVTAVAVAKDGTVYATAVGTKSPGGTYSPAPLPPPAPTSSNSSDRMSSGTTITVRASGPPPASMGSSSVTISGGSELYRIDSSGNPQRLWGNSQDIVYTIALDAQNRPLIGTGNKGFIYRIESPTLYTALLNSPPTQITALVEGPGGVLYATSGNVGKLYQIGPGLEKEGHIESDVFDAGYHSMWGRLEFRGSPNGGTISIVTRTGNLDQPQKNWSPWSSAVTDPKGARVNSPAARFAQWKATLTAGASGSPELEEVDFAYLPKNVPPRVDQIEITPPNYRFPTPAQPSSSPATLSLPPIGKRSSGSGSSGDSGGSSMQFAKGNIGARWQSADENGDPLIYTIEIRGKKEKQWKLLKEKVKEKYLSFDSTAFPDGEYLLRVTASDLPGNPPDQALSTRLESDPFLIDNTPPAITGLAATRAGANLIVRWKAADGLSELKKAEYSLDGGEWTIVAPVSQLSDSLELDYELTLKSVAAGEHTIAVRVEDEYDNQSTAKTVIE
jgi:sugar lactone lactonase YvrE